MVNVSFFNHEIHEKREKEENDFRDFSAFRGLKDFLEFSYLKNALETNREIHKICDKVSLPIFFRIFSRF